MKLFDLPYNFDKDLIEFYRIFFKKGEQMVHSIYFPPIRDDYIGAKNFTKIIPYVIGEKPVPLNVGVYDTIPSREDTYFSHINLINQYFPDKGCLLLQSTYELMDKYTLKKYIEHGIKKFCVGSVKQAKIIKKILPEAEITGSITMKIMPEDLKNKELYKDFNNFVLWFPYNKNFELLAQLPKDFNYSLLVNCTCSKECSGDHWLVDSLEKEMYRCKTCPTKKENYNIDQDSIYIRPADLRYYDDYISFYKFQGREHSTPLIISDIAKYTGLVFK